MATRTQGKRTRSAEMAPIFASAAEARSFETYSEANAMLAMLGRDCGCLAYEDIFTFSRWEAQGFRVRKGEKARRVPCPTPIYRKNPVTGKREKVLDDDGRPVMRKRMVPLFCRCQVEWVGA